MRSKGKYLCKNINKFSITKFISLFRIIPNFYSPIDNSIFTIIFVE